MPPMQCKKPCRAPGCGVATLGKYCPDHVGLEHSHITARAQVNPTLQAAAKWYDSPQWKRLRREHLKREPLCRNCRREGKTVVAQMVDHITPISVGGARTDISNYQSLCNRCHATKRQRESLATRGKQSAY